MKHIHFIGIGGISMSSLACIYLAKGYTVSGSDIKESAVTDALIERGISVRIGQVARNITDDIDVCVYTAAVRSDNPELIAAKARCPRVIERSVLLGELMSEYRHSIGIAGTHGKTSTSTMLSYIFLASDLDPTITIGGILRNLNTNYRIGQSDYFIAEACEYSDSFLQFHPEIGIVLNVEAEHLDYFKTYENMADSFRKYVDGFKDGGCLICNLDYIHLFPEYTGRVVTASLTNPAADIHPQNICLASDHLGCTYDCIYRGENLGTITLRVPGSHNVFDSLCAIAAAYESGIDFATIRRGLDAYQSPKKRFEYKGTFNGVRVIDDYAHHPSEIRATLRAAREVAGGEIFIVFQPHTYSRTKFFFDDFAAELACADHVVLADIYAAREPDPGDISAKDLAAAIRARGTDCTYLPSFDEIRKFVVSHVRPNDLLITMGAGDVSVIGDQILKQYR